MDEKKGKNKKGLKVILTIVIIAAACMLGFCIYKLVGINQSYQDANNLYQDVENMFETNAQAGQTDRSAAGADPAQENVTEDTQQAAEDVTEDTQQAAENVSEDAQQPAEDVTEDAQQAAQDVTEEAQQPAEDVTEDAQQAAENVTEDAQLAAQDVTEDAQQAADGVAAGTQSAAAPEEPEPVRYASLKWDYQRLLDVCADGVGYIYQEGTPISYPVVQAEDNDKYLRHMINGEYNVAGSIFVDCHFPEGLDGRYSFIYGHNMDDKSMFGSITAYKDEEYYKKHPEFELYVGDDCYVYYVFSAFQPAVTDFVFTYDFEDDEDFVEKMQMARELCPYETDAPEITKDSIVTFLSTCIDYPRDYNYRYIVMLVRGEKIENGNEQKITYNRIPRAVLNRNSDVLKERLQAESHQRYMDRYVNIRGNILFSILYDFKYNETK